MARRRITAFVAGRIVQAFRDGMGVAEIAYWMRISRDRVETTLRRHSKRRKR